VSIAIEVVDRTGSEQARAPVIALVGAVLRAEKAGGAVTVAFVGEREMTELNGRFRGLSEPTDVLSFRYADGDDEWPESPGAEPGAASADGEGQPAPDLGEVIVCTAVVDRYAREEGTCFGVQLAWTLVHGVLHLVGYDHEEDDGEMRRRERVLLEELGPLVHALAPSQDR